VDYVNNFKVRNVSKVDIFVLGDELIREVHHQKKNKCQGYPPKLINVNYAIEANTLSMYPVISIYA
jgi:hypothetical protein